MGNLTFSEILWILVIILIVFGPQRLPEIARKVGRFAAKARDAATALQRQITEEYGDAVAPLRDVRNDLKEVRRSLTDTARAAAGELEETTKIKDVAEELRAAKDQMFDGVTGAAAKEGAAEETPESDGETTNRPEIDEDAGA